LKKQVVERAIKKAEQSLCTYKISAIGLGKRGEIIYTAMNKSRFMRKFGGSHAEMEVMRRGGSGVRTIIICRVGNSGLVLPISPCPMCSAKAKELGIRIISVGV
jgi:tRNA(Arg) A34 adenosine deaminase TadA